MTDDKETMEESEEKSELLTLYGRARSKFIGTLPDETDDLRLVSKIYEFAEQEIIRAAEFVRYRESLLTADSLA